MLNNLIFDENIHLDFFDLNKNPFPVTPDSSNFFSTNTIEQIIVEIVHGIVTRKGFLVLTGEVGLGKTTICRKILELLQQTEIETALILHPVYDNLELIKEINKDFGILCNSSLISDQIQALSTFLIEQHKLSHNCAIIVDDAQNLTFENFELLRMLSNLETKSNKLVQILLTGQPELITHLDTHNLRQLKSRVIIKKEVKPLTKDEIIDYITYKMHSAGNSGKTGFSSDSVSLIAKHTGGNIRKINILMDRSLYAAFIDNSPVITKESISEALHDLDFSKTPLLPQKMSSAYLLSAAISFVVILIAFTFFSSSSKPLQPLPETLTQDGLTPETPYKIAPATHPLPEKQSYDNMTTNIPEKRVPLTYESDDVYTNVVIPDSFRHFVSSYSLNEYEKPLYSSIKDDNYQKIKEEVFESTGLVLVKLPEISNYLDKVYNIISIESISETPNRRHYLFWKPDFRVSNFYYFYKDSSIGHLQQALSAAGFYNTPVDNIVGKQVMLGVRKFQEKMNLPVTGFPDDNTIFLLIHSIKQG